MNPPAPQSDLPRITPAAPSRRRALAALALSAVMSPTLARARTLSPPAPPPHPNDPADQTLTTGHDEAERLTTPVYVNGQGPFNFLVDTGANRSGVSRELAATLNLPPATSARVHGIAGPYDAQTVDIRDLRIGGFRIGLKGAPVFARADLGADGLIGLDVLHDRVVRLDFRKNEIQITRRDYDGPGSRIIGPAFIGSIIPARQRFGQLTIIDAEAGRAQMTCFIDTGADQSVGNLALKHAVQAHLKPEEVVSADITIRSATGQTVAAVVALVPSMRIGGVNFSSFGLAFADLHTFDLWDLKGQPALLVGIDLLKLFDIVTIDFSERRVIFEKR